MLALLDESTTSGTAPWPEIMLRRPVAQDWSRPTVVCGCGGGEAIQEWLPQILEQAPQLVLDADALNAIACEDMLRGLLYQRAARGHITVLTPHPLEIARLIGETPSARIQDDRLRAAQTLADDTQCLVALKGSGTVLATPTCSQMPASPPVIHYAGNGRLATAGTGDVLAGSMAAYWARTPWHDAAHAAGSGAWYSAHAAASAAIHAHGLVANQWASPSTLTASALARALPRTPLETDTCNCC